MSPQTKTRPKRAHAKPARPKSEATARTKAPPKTPPKVPATSKRTRTSKASRAKGPARARKLSARRAEALPDRRLSDAPGTLRETPHNLVAEQKQVVAPIKVDNHFARTDNDALEGGFAQIVSGPHQGRYGYFESVVEYGPDGYPTKVSFITRDQGHEHLTVKYADLRPSTAGGRVS